MLAARDPEASKAFEALAAQAPDDPLIRFHRERLARGETGDEITLDDK
ncbi:hypothetical protein IIB79_12555 [candidate division KSB1 bacterium]|nr:hypothetical protein [candidate division KSB1 bacterium]